MRPTEPPARSLHATRIASLLLAATVTAACAPARSPTPPPPRPVPPGSIEVSLVFGDEADLDLYVTGPDRETVYFANTPGRAGGSLVRDLRCDAGPGVRVETVEIPHAPAGRYRVGVDFAERCRLPAQPVAFRIVVAGSGLHEELGGEIELGVFRPVVLEFDHAGSPGAGLRSRKSLPLSAQTRGAAPDRHEDPPGARR